MSWLKSIPAWVWSVVPLALAGVSGWAHFSAREARLDQRIEDNAAHVEQRMDDMIRLLAELHETLGQLLNALLLSIGG